MILGVGTDILNIQHFEKAFKKTPTLIQRVFTKNEQKSAPANKVKKTAYYAKRFSAKEAFSKACGTGIGKDIRWQDIEIRNDAQGAPFILLSKKATDFICQKFKVKKFKMHLSLSDDKEALAFVIIEK